MDYEFAKNSFLEYIKNYDMKNKNILLKYHHTFRVVRLMEVLAKKLELSDKEMTLAKIIGLLHDIGRFEQIKENNSFEDTQLDHARLGCDYLFKENHIRDFVNDDKYDNIIYEAILNHNKLKIDKTVQGESLRFSKMIRDADKIDILQIAATNFEFELFKEEITPTVLKRFKNEKLIDKKMLKTKSDKTLLYLAYIFDINFLESFDLLYETDNLGLFISSIEIPRYSEEFASEIIGLINKKMEKNLEKGGYNVREKI